MSENNKSSISIAKYSNIGGRSENEDSCGYFTDGRGNLLAVVADGLGGEGGGAKASSAAVQVLEDCFKTGAAVEPSDFSEWFQRANEMVLSMQTKECAMKTTLVTLQLSKKAAMWAHVGDTRLYHFVNGSYESRTFDHSVSQMAVLRREISEDEIRGHVDRNRLLKAIGRDEEVLAECSGILDVADGNRHAFLLCTDGFWEYVYENEMEDILKRSENAKQWLIEMANILKERAKPDHDNNTAIAVIIG